MALHLTERLLRRLVGALSMRFAEPVPRESAAQLLERLRPIDCGRPLVRIGPSGDGGYLVPDDLDGVTHCFSPGVSSISGFELDLVDRGITCFLADHSVEAPEIAHEKMVFEKKYVGCYTDDTYMTLDDWAAGCLPKDAGDLLLQMDIEGAEYEVFLNVSDDLLKRFRILVVEFHYLSRWLDKPYHRVVTRVFDKLMRYFDVVHLHPNNHCQLEQVDGFSIPPLMEFTLLRKDRVRKRAPRSDFPHLLDVDNTGNAPVVLPRTWYETR